MRERWFVAYDGRSSARPTVLGDVVYFGTGDGRVVAHDRATGAARWSAAVGVGEAVEGRNLVARAGVVVAPVARHVVGLDAATGRELWRYAPPPDVPYGGAGAAPGQVVESYIDADDGAAYVPAWGASVSALDLRTGAVRWIWEPGPAAGDTAARRFRSGSMGARVSGDTVFATVWHFLDRLGLRSEAWVVALDRATGRELWRAVLPRYTGGVSIEGAPAFYPNLVIVSTRGGHAWALDRASGALVWHYAPQTLHATFAQAEVYGDGVYIDGGDGRVYALRAADGTVLWRSAPFVAATRDMMVTDRRVYCVYGGRLSAFDRATGRLVAVSRARGAEGDTFETHPAIADGSTFIGVTAGAVSFREP